MPNQVTLDPHGFIRHTYKGDQDSVTVGHVITQTMAIIRDLQAKGDPRTINLLVDLSAIDKLPLSARKAGAKALQSLPYQKIAIIGGNPFLRQVVNFVIMAARKQNKVKQLSSEATAIAWLDEDE